MSDAAGRAGPRPPRRAVPQVVRAAALALGPAALFTAEVVFVKLLANTVPVTTIMLTRASAQLVYVLPALARRGAALLRTDRPLLHVCRGLFSLLSWGFYYWSFQRLDLATATVLSFTSVMFVTALARPVLGESVGWPRWSATLAGFGGVVLVARPFSVTPDPAILIALLSALSGSGIVLTTKRLAATERTDTIMAYIGIVTFAGSLPIAAPTLGMPEPWQVGWLAAMAAAGPAGMHLWIASFRHADATVIAPLGYSRLVFAAVIGATLFGEWPDGWMVSGAIVIVASVLALTLLEARRGDAAARRG